MRNTILLLTAILLTVMLFFVLLIRRTVMLRHNHEKMAQFHFKVAKHLDELWCLLIWGIEDHTVSATVYDKNMVKWVKFINLIFADENHCHNAWLNEYN